MKTAEIIRILDELDDEELESGDIVLHVPDEQNRPTSDCDSDDSDDEIAGNLNKFGGVLLNTPCDFIPHLPPEHSIESDMEESEQASTKSRKKKKQKTIQWNTKDNAPKFPINSTQPNSDFLPEEVMSATTEYELFRLFIDQPFIENLVA